MTRIPESTRQMALEYIPQVGISAVALALRISPTTVRRWWIQAQSK